MEKELKINFISNEQNENDIIKKVQKLRFQDHLTFKKISERLKIDKSKVIHYCTDLKYRT
jgi:DNA-binding transcriptional regulator LsrR (DeoR family)